jgi:hypothetical protein
LKLYDPELRFGKGTMLFNSQYCQDFCNTPIRPTRVHVVPDVPPKERPENVVRPVAAPTTVIDKPKVYSVSLREMSMYARGGLKVYRASLDQVNKALEDIDKTGKQTVDLPVELKDYCDVFSPKEAEKLLPYRPYVANMPQLCAAAYGCLEGMWLPTLGYRYLSSIVYIVDSHYLDMISNNAVIINAHLCSHSEQVMSPGYALSHYPDILAYGTQERYSTHSLPKIGFVSTPHSILTRPTGQHGV